MRHVLGAIAVLVLVVLAIGTFGVATAAPSAAEPSVPMSIESSEASEAFIDRGVEQCAATPPANFSDPDGNSSDVIGWVDGYWYNETVEINQSDGLTDEELHAVTARTAARYEALRCWTFDELPPIELQDRETFQEEQAELFAGIDDDERRFENAKFEALLAVPTEEDAIDQREANLGAAVLGYYDPVAGTIVLISDDPNDLRVDEVTLAHELGHAAQDQRYDLTSFDAQLVDGGTAENGLIEGDVVMVERRYEQLCENGEWDCVGTDDEGSEFDVANWPLYLSSFQPYSDGPSLVVDVFERGGWEAVDRMYDDPPTTSRQVINPADYPQYGPRILTIDDNVTDEWQRVEVSGRPDHERFGQAALAATLMAPTFETNGRDGLYAIDDVYNLDDDRQTDPFDPFNYDHDAVTGWHGDRLHVFVNDDDETASVWKIAWETTDDATTFKEHYTELLEYHGAQSVNNRDDLYRFPGWSPFEGGVFLDQNDDELVIIHAPSVSAIDTFRSSDDVSSVDFEGVGMDTDGVFNVEPVTDSDPPRELDVNRLPGFGIAVAALAVLVVAVVLRRR